MSVTARDFLSFARQFAQNQMDSRDEMGLRTAINRFYYAAYHGCAPLADELPEPSRLEGGVHQQRIQRFMSFPLSAPSGSPLRQRQEQMRVLGRRLKDAHRFRVQADYRLQPVVTPEDLRKCIGIVNDIDRLLNTLVADLHRPTSGG
ncbi:MAG: hypothetical protein HQL51_01550 [Magnetococcales bacterium]|nr:hypothetical protein [Magnetococcales bacterium]